MTEIAIENTTYLQHDEVTKLWNNLLFVITISVGEMIDD
jgi:hypothetical protein